MSIDNKVMYEHDGHAPKDMHCTCMLQTHIGKEILFTICKMTISVV
jgi:hypothetical protein